MYTVFMDMLTIITVLIASSLVFLFAYVFNASAERERRHEHVLVERFDEHERVEKHER